MKSTTTGLAEEFIAAFNRFEAEEHLFALRDGQGFPWWDLVRYRVQFALCVERDIYGRQAGASPARMVRARSFCRQSWRLLRDIARIRGREAGKARSIVVSRRPLGNLGEAAADVERGEAAIFVNKSGEAPAPHMAIRSQSIQFFTRVAQRVQPLPAEVEQDALRLDRDIKQRFGSQMDIFGIIVTKYREELAARRAWSFVLNHADSVERVIYANDDALKSLVALARARGIHTEEIQHAYMGRAHIGFSYPPLEDRLTTLPDRVVVTRDTGDITYPVERIVLKSAVKQRKPVPRDIDVLIASSPARRKQTVDIVAALVGLGVRLAVKLHPAETKESSEITARFSQEEVAIHAGDEDFCDLAWRARVFVPVNATSTTTFEAVEMGARLVLIEFGGVKRTSITDGLVSARADCLRTLPGVVLSQLSAHEGAADHSNKGEI